MTEHFAGFSGSGKRNVSSGLRKLPPLIPFHLSRALPIFRDIPDLSSEVRILGDVPAAYGTLSYIWLGELSNGRQVAVKRMISTKSNKIFFRELVVWLRAISHEHVLPLLGIARVDDSLAFVSPYMPGRSLGLQISTCSIPERVRILTEVAGALAFLHRNNILYGYLSMSTILLDQEKKAYLSSFLFSQTDWTEFFKVDSTLYPSQACPVYPDDTDPIKWEDDVLAFGTFLVLVRNKVLLAYGGGFSDPNALLLQVLSEQNPSSRFRQNHVLGPLLAQGRHKEALGSPDIPEEIWDLALACCEDIYEKIPTMEQVHAQMLKILQSMEHRVPKHIGFEPHPSSTPVKDISPEIKKLSEYPIAGGGYCDLYLGERLGKEKVALKLVRLLGPTEKDKQRARRSFMSEAQIWGNLYHPRILEFYGICDYGTLSMYMVSPFLQNGNIINYLSKINPNANRHRLLVETAEGLVYLHNRNPPIIHGDMKGANILISDSGTAILADFGLSRISHEITSSTLHGVGSPRWMAPELMQVDDTIVGPLKTIQSDVYGYGHIILEVLSNEKPFYNIRDDLRVIVELINGRRSARPTGPIARQWLDDISWAYCQRCTDPDPAMRPRMNDILNYLRKIYRL